MFEQTDEAPTINLGESEGFPDLSVHSDPAILAATPLEVGPFEEPPEHEEIARLVEQVLPLTPDRSRHNRIYELRSELLLRYHEAPDLRDFRGTGWGFINAVSDLVSHTAPKRYTTTFQENRFAKVTSGAVELDRAVRLLLAM